MKIFLSDWAKRKGRTMASIAQEIGITAPSLSQIDNGKTWARSETLDKLGEALGVPPEWLFFYPASELMQYAQEISSAQVTSSTQEGEQARYQETEATKDARPLGAIICPHCGTPMSIFAI